MEYQLNRFPAEDVPFDFTLPSSTLANARSV